MAWDYRAEVDRVILDEGIVPESYLDVIVGMIPTDVKDAKMRFRGIGVQAVTQRLLAGVIWDCNKSWMKTWVHEKCYGGVEGRELLEMAWDIQGEVEDARWGGDRVYSCLCDRESRARYTF